MNLVVFLGPFATPLIGAPCNMVRLQGVSLSSPSPSPNLSDYSRSDCSVDGCSIYHRSQLVLMCHTVMALHTRLTFSQISTFYLEPDSGNSGDAKNCVMVEESSSPETRPKPWCSCPDTRERSGCWGSLRRRVTRVSG